MIAAYTVAFCAAYVVGSTVSCVLADLLPPTARWLAWSITALVIGAYGACTFWLLVVGR